MNPFKMIVPKEIQFRPNHISAPDSTEHIIDNSNQSGPTGYREYNEAR